MFSLLDDDDEDVDVELAVLSLLAFGGVILGVLVGRQLTRGKPDTLVTGGESLDVNVALLVGDLTLLFPVVLAENPKEDIFGFGSMLVDVFEVVTSE